MVMIVFMVTRQLPRHRFNQDRSFGGRCMRYAIRATTAALPMPPLPRGVVPAPERTLPVATFCCPARLASTLHRTTPGAIPVAAVAPRAHPDQHPAVAAGEHAVAVHGGTSLPPGTGREPAPSATLRRADVAACRSGCCRKPGRLSRRSSGFRLYRPDGRSTL